MAWWDRITGRKGEKPQNGAPLRATPKSRRAPEEPPPPLKPDPAPEKAETRPRKKKSETRVPAPSRKASPPSPSPDLELCTRGALRQSRGDTDGALADYSKAIQINPLCAKAYAGRGLARELKGDLTGAKADYSKSVEIELREALNASFPEAGLGNTPPSDPEPEPQPEADAESGGTNGRERTS